jgi:Domain of unknown function (DUF1877)
MGKLASYISIDEQRLDAFWWQEDAAFRESFLEIEDDENLQRLGIDKIWDALHFTLTGQSASNPVSGNKLSESIVGVQPKIYDDEDYSIFVSVIDNDEILPILAALEEIDHQKLSSLLDPACMKEQKIYPNGIWNDPPDQLIAEMEWAIQSMKEFFRKVHASGNHILATVL